MNPNKVHDYLNLIDKLWLACEEADGELGTDELQSMMAEPLGRLEEILLELEDR